MKNPKQGLLRRSRSFKVIEVGTNRKPVCNFLLVTFFRTITVCLGWCNKYHCIQGDVYCYTSRPPAVERMSVRESWYRGWCMFLRKAVESNNQYAIAQDTFNIIQWHPEYLCGSTPLTNWLWSRLCRSCMFPPSKFGPSFSSPVGRALIYLVSHFPIRYFSVDPPVVCAFVRTDSTERWRVINSNAQGYTLGCHGYGDSRGNSHGYGYGMGMRIMINPRGLMEDTGLLRSTSVGMGIP